MALTDRERQILRLKAEGVSDYKIARKLKIETPNVTRSRKNALKKIERARTDLMFVDGLKTKTPKGQFM
jgi:transcriptional regulator